MNLRKILFWLHLSAGVFAGVIVFIMSVTGVLLTYEKQMLAWSDLRHYRSAPPPGAQRLSIDALLAKVRDEKGSLPAAVTLRPHPSDPVAFVFGREGTVYANPYTGELLGAGSTGLRSFFRVVTDWHRWLGAGTEGRATGKAITGACNLAFLFLVCSGLYLWWPRNWRWVNVKSVVLFRGGLGGKARDFNWHNVIGFWCCVPLFFVVLGATVISYPWASNLVYRAAGEEPPARRGPGGPGPASSGPRRGGPGGAGDAPAELSLEGFDKLQARASQQVPGWTTISLRLPASDGEPVSFVIDQGSGQPHLRSTLTLNRQTAAVERWETFSGSSRGQQWRSFLRFIHTGEIGGFPGQTIAGIASLGACFLVWTGLALSWRRYRAWMGRRGSAPGVPVRAAATRAVTSEREIEEQEVTLSKRSSNL